MGQGRSGVVLRNKRQGTRDKEQETRNKRQGTRGKKQESNSILIP
jgi:hypothetical protein